MLFIPARLSHSFLTGCCRETESGRFSDAVKALSGRDNPLADIGEQLRKRMKQEEEEQGTG